MQPIASLPHEVRADLPQEVRVRLGCALYVHPTPEIAVFAREAIQKFEAWDLVCQQGQQGWRAVHSMNYWCWWRRRVACAAPGASTSTAASPDDSST